MHRCMFLFFFASPTFLEFVRVREVLFGVGKEERGEGGGGYKKRSILREQ